MTALTPFADLCERLAGTTKKLDKRQWMSEYLQRLPVEDAARAALYLAGTPFAETDSRKLSVGGSLLTKVVLQLSGAAPDQLHRAYLRHGDIGSAAFDLLPEPSAPDLTLADLEQLLADLAAARGPAPRLHLLVAMLARATPLEAKYTLKLISGDMRIGVKQAQVEEAVAEAYAAKLAEVRHAHMLTGNLPDVVALAASGRLDTAAMRLFHSLGFMLASPVASVDEALARYAEEVVEIESGAEPAAAAAPALLRAGQIEDKYDGIRAQLHCGDLGDPARVALFSRTREDLSQAFPELIEAFAHAPSPLILDGEILAWNPHTDPPRALSFSTLQQRIGRKKVTREMREDTPVVFMAFDLLYDGRLLLEQPLRERRAQLELLVRTLGPHTAGVRAGAGQAGLFLEPRPGFPRLMLAPATPLESAEQLDQAYADARSRGNEGVMLKAGASLYQPGRRGLAWLKLKRELASLDVVVTAAEWGHGRRAGTLSDYTFAVRAEPTGELLNVGKAYSGLTDAEIAELSNFFEQHTLEDHGWFRTVEPILMLEVAFNNVMRSDRHSSGFALRFPRILRIRRDKPVEEIDTLARVEQIYNSQPDRDKSSV